MTASVHTRMTLPPWRGGATLTPVSEGSACLDRYSRIGICFDDEPDEDALDYLEQVVGYAWSAHMHGVAPFDEGRISTHDTIVVLDAEVRSRICKTRTRAKATLDLVEAISRYYVEGSPLRLDGKRLVERPTGDLPSITGFLIG